jgi:peptide/nickel transport system substrate-binding protein
MFRVRIWASVLVGLVVILGACTAPTTGPSASQSADTGPIDPRRTTLNIGHALEANSFDPQVNTAQFSAQKFYPNIYEGLVRWGADGNLNPMLAESWTASPDGLTYRFKLRSNVQFSDGTPFNAAAVKSSFDRFRSLAKGAVLLFEPIDKVNPIDSTTVEFALKRPYAPFLAVMASWQAAIFVSPTAIETNAGTDNAQTWLKNHTAGTGPFVLDSWVPNSTLVLTRNSHFREAPQGDSIQRIVYHFISEPSTQRQQLRNGDIDILDVVPPSILAPMRTDPGVNVTLSESLGSAFGFWVMFNLSRKPFDDVNLRQAVAYAIDYKRLVALWNGIAEQAEGPYPPSFAPWFSKSDVLQYNQDLTKAGDALKRGGYQMPLNPRIKITLVWQAAVPVQRDMSTLIKDDLAKIGIDVDVQGQEIAVQRENIWTHNFDMMWFQETHRFADPDAFVSFQLHSSEWRYGGTNPGVRDPHIDDLIAQGKQTSDQSARQKIYNEIQKLVTNNPPYLFVLNAKQAWAAGNDVIGINWIPAYGQFWYGQEIKKKVSRT